MACWTALSVACERSALVGVAAYSRRAVAPIRRRLRSYARQYRHIARWMNSARRLRKEASPRASLAIMRVASLQDNIVGSPYSLGFQTFAKRVPRAEQEHSEVVGRYLENLTHLIGVQLIHLA